MSSKRVKTRKMKQKDRQRRVDRKATKRSHMKNAPPYRLDKN